MLPPTKEPSSVALGYNIERRHISSIMGKQAEYQERKKVQIIDTLKAHLGEDHPMPTSWQLAKVLNRFKDPESMAAAWAEAHSSKTPKTVLQGVLLQPEGDGQTPSKTPSKTPQGHDCSPQTVQNLPRHMKLDLVRSILGSLGEVSRIIYESEDIAQVVRLNEILGILQNISEDSSWLSSTRRAIYRKAQELCSTKELEETKS